MLQTINSNSLLWLFKGDVSKYQGVAPIKIYLLRTLFTLMFFFLSFDSWKHILNHTGQWEPADSAAWCMWAACSGISIIGIIRPLKMLPIVLFEIVYKSAWLIIVAYPLWTKDKLEGSSIEYTTYVFLGVIAPIIFMPWLYFFKTYILGAKD